MSGLARYLRLSLALARFSLARELAFRGNFVVKIIVELLWLGILLTFYGLIFKQTSVVADWSESQYLFFVGCYFALEGLIETLFLENCNEFADLVRSGDLDFFLLQPIDEQFLITCRKIDWSTAPNIFLGAAVMGLALHRLGWTFDAGQVALFVLLFGCGTMMAYSFLVLLTATSVWLVRNQSLFEMWWLVTSLMRYPREVFQVGWATPLGWVFTFLVPVMLVVSVPAETMVRALTPGFAFFMCATALVLLGVSRRVFRTALRRYRSASS
jgi:ABC-2 type transport system permease protein